MVLWFNVDQCGAQIFLKICFHFSFEFRCHCSRQGFICKALQDVLLGARVQYTFTRSAEVWLSSLMPHHHLLMPEDPSGPGQYLVGFLVPLTQKELVHIYRFMYGKDSFKICNIHFFLIYKIVVKNTTGKWEFFFHILKRLPLLTSWYIFS